MSSFQRFGLVLVLLVLPWGGSCGTPEPRASSDSSTAPLRIHMISGASEYQSARSLSTWKKRLEDRYNIRCTIHLGTDRTKTLRGVDTLSEADLLVLFNRRFELNDRYWAPIKTYLASGRPVLGVRTASHAFDRNYPNIDTDLLGADYYGHGEREEVRVRIAEGAAGHPILDGVSAWTRTGKLYKNRTFQDTTQVLLTGHGASLSEPVAWINRREGQRIFYTSMGLPADFKNQNFLRLLTNAVEWTTDRSLD